MSFVPIQTDEALRLLADLYTRRFQKGTPAASDRLQLARWHACELVRNTLSQAQDQPDALRQLTRLAEQVEEAHVNQEAEATAWRGVVQDAHTLVELLIEAGGGAYTLLAGATDGYRHLCLHCCQDEHKVRFFNHAARRPLLMAELRTSGQRSMYDRCQICLQALAPVKCVVLIPTGTIKHDKNCVCKDCNQGGIASVIAVYESHKDTHALHLPALLQVAAPSQQQARKRAFETCWQQGWYVLGSSPLI